MRVTACGLSEVGRVRAHNEDAFEIDSERGLFVVADGMGGHGHGEVASQIAVDAIGGSIRDSVPKAHGVRRMWLSATSGAEKTPAERMERAMLEAHEKILQAIREDSSLAGMGTTAVGLLVEENVGTVAHVGDSRIYLHRDGVLEQITEDHTWVNEQVLAGFLSREQARSHPLKSVVTRAVGGEGEIMVDIGEISLRAGDRFMICSDGLTGMLTDDQIRGLLAEGGSLEAVCRHLIEGANEAGGLDNITVVLLAVEEDH